MEQSTQIHPSAVVDPRANIGEGTSVGPFTVIGPDVSIGVGSTVGSHCLLGEGNHGPLEIGANANIRSHSVLYGGSSYGDMLETGHRVTLREGLVVGLNLRVGTLCDLQGHATIGDCVRMHSNVHVGQQSRIESFAWIFPYVVLTNDPHPPSEGFIHGPTIGEGAVVATMSVVLPGVQVGAWSLVAAGAVVTKDVNDGRVVRGAPARDVAATTDVGWTDSALAGSPYPWHTHFRRGYPEQVDFTVDGPVATV